MVWKGHQKGMCLKEIGLGAHTMLQSISWLNGQHNWGGGPICPLKEHMNLCIDHEYDIHMSSKHHKENGYGHNITLNILH